jgi:colicin import membrane protein
LALALLAHALLIGALAWGLRWKNDIPIQSVEAELWSATAQMAAPKPVPPPPPQPPTPEPQPIIQPPPKPVPQVDDAAARQAAELALEQKKREEQVQVERLRQAAAAKAKAAQQAAQAKADAAKKAAEQKAQAEREAKVDATRRQNALRRMNALAGADETGTATTPTPGQGKSPGGTARRDAGPSAGYGAKVVAWVRPRIVYPNLDELKSNPKAEVEVTTAADGTILSNRLVKSSGVSSWDDAVQNDIVKAQNLPRDTDGRVPSPIIIEVTPR